MICKICWENKDENEFEIRPKNECGYSIICDDCRDLSKLKMSDKEKLRNIMELDKIFFKDELIIRNKRISWRKYTNDDKFYFFLSKWYNKSWLKLVYDKVYIRKMADISHQKKYIDF